MSLKGVRRQIQCKFQSILPSSRRRKWDRSSSDELSSARESGYYSQQALRPPSLDAPLDALFDTLRDEQNDAKDRMELESTMNYLSSNLGVNIENAELFVALELLQVPAIGEITRKGYIEGWKNANVEPNHKEHAKHLQTLVAALPRDTALFKKVYKYAFIGGREKDQKALSLENALVYWDMLFAPPGIPWKNQHRDWLALWKAFLAEKWTRSVNRDMWNMVLEFAFKSMDDDTLSFWNEDGAWPSVIDDFVQWCKAKGIGKSEQMDVDGE
ncbi:hypothetical protein NQ176_g11238 [Zarea fungicola]|uniref:Uncharacterized protein n=1 Tax=Zarea fungicola TaxID=93591 RepID=A0ACC1MBB3_9HYPO|nr:hypothetical protein NQ176_g11238 [Lecanicillium fungicola]